METRPLRIVRISKTRWQIEVQKSFLWWSWWAPVQKVLAHPIGGIFRQPLAFATLASAEEYIRVLRSDFTPEVVSEYP